MTISKKLLVMGALILGMQQITQAYSVSANSHYNTTQMLNFAQTLRQFHTNKQALKVAQWLKEQVCDSYGAVSNADLESITRIIDNHTLNMESKIAVLSQAMNNKRQLFFVITCTLIAAGVTVLLANCVAIGTHLLISEIQNSTLSKMMEQPLLNTPSQPKPVKVVSYYQ